MFVFYLMLMCWQPDIKGLGRLGECVRWHWGAWEGQRGSSISTEVPHCGKDWISIPHSALLHYALWKKPCLYSYPSILLNPSAMCSGQCAKAIQMDLSCKIWIQIQVLWVTVWTFGSALCSPFSKMYLPGVETVQHIHLQLHLIYISMCGTLT